MSHRMLEFDEDDIAGERPDWRARAQQWLMRHPKDAVAFLVAGVAAFCIAANALMMQTGPHPAPLFALRPAPAIGSPASIRSDENSPIPRGRPGSTDGSAVVQVSDIRTHAELVAAVQRELAKRGFYDGAVDGVYGPKTDAAVRDFGQHAHVKVPTQPNAKLLTDIVSSKIGVVRPAPPASMSRSHRDPIADLIGPSSRILAVQRALSDYGYGQIKPTGIVGSDTTTAIEKFERARQMPVTGQMSDRLVRELAAVTGRPLE